MNVTVEKVRRDQRNAKRRKGWPQLERKLLSIARGRVVPTYEPALDQLLRSGALITGRVKVRTGEPNRCHLNASVQWLRNPKATIYTGYYYCDGLWRQHSWNLLTGVIIDMYDHPEIRFGVACGNPLQALHFATGELVTHNPGLVDAALRRAVSARSKLK